jgi:hypothetical protein
MLRRKKKQQPEKKPARSESTLKAKAKNVGSGSMEFVDNTIKFYLEKGTVKKKKQTAITLSISDIESLRQEKKQLIVVWNGVTDTFTLQKPEKLAELYAKVNAALSERKPTPEQAAEKRAEEEHVQKRVEIPQMILAVTEIIDPLFDTLKSLQRKINWGHVENCLKIAEEKADAFAEQKPGSLNLKFAKAFAAAKSHVPDEVGKETYVLLMAIRGYFKDLLSDDDPKVIVHPSNKDALDAVQAYLTLNDIFLGVEVADEVLAKENAEFLKMLKRMEEETGASLNGTALGIAANRIAKAKDKENAVSEAKNLFKQQVGKLVELAKNPPLLVPPPPPPQPTATVSVEEAKSPFEEAKAEPEETKPTLEEAKPQSEEAKPQPNP